MIKILTLLILMTVSASVKAQSVFTATPDLVIAEKPADYFVFYNYTEFENLIGDTLNIKWEQTELMTFLGGSEMGDWELAISDPENSYFQNPPDSAVFKLGPVQVPTDKFIFQLYPNGQIGWLMAKYKFFPENDPSDSLVVTFDYMATDPSTSNQEISQYVQVSINPNPSRFFWQLVNHSDKPFSCELLDITGRILSDFHLPANGKKDLDGSFLSSGIYFLKLEQAGLIAFRKLVLEK